MPFQARLSGPSATLRSTLAGIDIGLLLLGHSLAASSSAQMSAPGRGPAVGDEQEGAAGLERRRRLSQDARAGGTGAYGAFPGVVSTAPDPKRGWDVTGSDSIL